MIKILKLAVVEYYFLVGFLEPLPKKQISSHMISIALLSVVGKLVQDRLGTPGTLAHPTKPYLVVSRRWNLLVDTAKRTKEGLCDSIKIAYLIF